MGRQSGTPRLEGRARGGERAWPMPCPLGLRLLPPQALQQPECHAERDAPSGRRQLPATKLPHNLAELGQHGAPIVMRPAWRSHRNAPSRARRIALRCWAHPQLELSWQDDKHAPARVMLHMAARLAVAE